MIKRFSSFANGLALLLFFVSVLPAQSQLHTQVNTSTTTLKVPLKPRKDIKGLDNFAKVSDILYRGAQPEKDGFPKLKELGIKTIISLRAKHPDDEYIKGLGFNYFNIPINTWSLNNKDVARFLNIVTDKANQPVFVHCQHGSDRTGTMVAVYRVYAQKWKADEAMKELPVFGFHKIWINLKKYLRNLDIKEVEEEMRRLRTEGAGKKS